LAGESNATNVKPSRNDHNNSAVDPRFEP
jgi:hypothetical protein